MSIGDRLNDAYFSLAKASWAGGSDLRSQLMQVSFLIYAQGPAELVINTYDFSGVLKCMHILEAFDLFSILPFTNSEGMWPSVLGK